MSNEVNFSKMYQFIASFGETWVDTADTNNNDIVSKAEFKKFVNENFAEWNGEEGGMPDEDLINKFWSSLDTTKGGKTNGIYNTNNLHANEIEAMNNKLGAYCTFGTFVREKVKAPDFIENQSGWLRDVESDLSVYVEMYINGKTTGGLYDVVLTNALPQVQNKVTAEYVVFEYQESLKDSLKDYPDYNISEDETLNKIISNYLNGLESNETPSNIQTAIKGIIDAYLATAGLSENEDYPIEDLGYSTDELNELQIAVITKSIKDSLSETAKNYENYADEFNAAVQQFIDAKLEAGGSFETLKGAASEFANSKYKTQLDQMIEINETYKDVKVSEDSDSFYQKLKEAFGGELADRIAKNDRYIKEYKDIINEVIAKVANGEMAMDEVENYIISQIEVNLEKFVGNMSDMSIEDMNSVYDKLAASAEANTNDDEALKLHREAAIKWCDAVAKKSDALKAKISEVFENNGYSSNYKTAINSMLPGDIAEIMTELKEAVLNVGDVNTMDIKQWNSNIPDKIMLMSTNTYDGNVTATINNVDSSRVTYTATVTDGDGNVEIDDYGNITIKSGNSKGFTVNVFAMVDGQKVGTPKSFRVKKFEEVQLDNCNGDFAGRKISDILAGGTQTSLILSNWTDLTTAKNNAITQICATLDGLGNQLKGINIGIDKDRIDYAVTTAKNFYTKAIEGMSDKISDGQNDKGHYEINAFTYTDGNGDTKTASGEKYRQYSTKLQRDSDGGKGARNLDQTQVTTGLNLEESWNKDDTYTIHINAQVLLQRFENFLNFKF